MDMAIAQGAYIAKHTPGNYVAMHSSHKTHPINEGEYFIQTMLSFYLPHLRFVTFLLVASHFNLPR